MAWNRKASSGHVAKDMNGSADVQVFVRQKSNPTKGAFEFLLAAHSDLLRTFSTFFAEALGPPETVDKTMQVEATAPDAGPAHAGGRPVVGAASHMLRVEIETRPSAFQEVIAWMYGAPIVIPAKRVLAWRTGGCDLLEVARDLGIEVLEDGLRHAISEAAGQMSPEVPWALLQVCHDFELRAELEQCCVEIARNGGAAATEAALAELPVAALDALLRSDSWIVDDEQQIFAVLEAWLLARPRGGEGCARALLALSGAWDLRWGMLPPEKLAWLAKQRVIPESLVWDCKRWAKMCRSRREDPLNRLPKKQDVKQRRKTREIQPFELKSRDVLPHDVQLRDVLPPFEAELDAQRAEAGTASQLQSLAQNAALIDLDAQLKRKGLVRLDDETIAWRKAAAFVPEGVMRNILQTAACSTSFRRLRRAMRCFTTAGDWAYEDETFPSESSIDACASEFSPWLGRRCCHHVHVNLSTSARSEFEFFVTERDRTLGRMCPRVPSLPSDGGQDVGGKPATSEATDAHLQSNEVHLVGCQSMNSGRHALLLRLQIRWLAGTKHEDRSEKAAAERKLFDRSISVRSRRSVRGSARCAPSFREEQMSVGDQSHGKLRENMASRRSARGSLRNPQSGIEDQASFGEASHAKLCDQLAHFLRFGIGASEAANIQQMPGKSSAATLSGIADQEPSSSKLPARQLAWWNDAGQIASQDNAEERHIDQGTAPVTYTYLPAGKVAASLKFNDEDLVLANVLNIAVLLVFDVEEASLQFAIDCMLSADAESHSDFFHKHKIFDRWTDERRLRDDLSPGIAIPQGKSFAFSLEIDKKKLMKAIGASGVFDMEILPRSALKRSWWINLMERSVDGQPHTCKACPPK